MNEGREKVAKHVECKNKGYGNKEVKKKEKEAK